LTIIEGQLRVKIVFDPCSTLIVERGKGFEIAKENFSCFSRLLQQPNDSRGYGSA
jgi:hypothetical protein